MKIGLILSKRKWLTVLPIVLTVGMLLKQVQAVIPLNRPGNHVDVSINRNYDNSLDCVENEVLVIFKRGIGLQDANRFAASRLLKIKRYFKTISRVKGRHYALLQSETSSVSMLMGTLTREAIVDFAGPNYRIHVCANFPNDPRFDELWGLHNTGQTGGTADIDIDALEAWKRIGRTPPVIVAVIDTGINYNHPDLAVNMWVNPGEVAGNGIDDDGNGYIDDVHGINSLSNNKAPGDPMDDNGHGSHCAGTIGAIANNGLDVIGVKRDIKLIAARSLDISGSGNYADALMAIDYIIDLKTTYNQNIVAINVSFGGSKFDLVFKDAIEAAGESGIILCVSAGNDYSDNDRYPFYPASYNSENIIAVTAVDHHGNQQYNYGADSVDLAAPGFDILSTKAWYQPKPGDVFFDDMESGADEWLTGGTKNTWALTTNQEGFADENFPIPSPPYFWSDKPGSNYAPDTHSWLMTKRNLDISGYIGQKLYLGFGSAMAIEKNYDNAYVEVSGNNGENWFTLMNFSGYGVRWRPSYFFLIPEELKTRYFRLRFRLKSDEQTQYWGWLLDDIGIGSSIIYGCEIQSGTSMAAPYVTGAIAYIAALYPLDTVSQRVKRILDNTVPLSTLSGICVTGGLLNLNNAAGDPPHITVTSPLEGETYTNGKTIPVKWSSWGISGDVRIILTNADGNDSFTITSRISYDNFPYDYTIPCAVPAGTYIVRVEKQGFNSTESGHFTINEGTCITVSKPAGGETFYPGDPLSIEWDTWGINGDVKISLIRSDLTASRYITRAVPFNNSPYLYDIPPGITGGSYYIGVKKQNQSFGRSAAFTIKPAVSSITVIKPAPGEVYGHSANLTIEWVTSGIIGVVTILLKRADGNGEYTISTATRHDGSPVRYRVPVSVSPGTYMVEIRQDSVYGVSGDFIIN